MSDTRTMTPEEGQPSAEGNLRVALAKLGETSVELQDAQMLLKELEADLQATTKALFSADDALAAFAKQVAVLEAEAAQLRMTVGARDERIRLLEDTESRNRLGLN